MCKVHEETVCARAKASFLIKYHRVFLACIIAHARSAFADLKAFMATRRALGCRVASDTIGERLAAVGTRTFLGQVVSLGALSTARRRAALTILYRAAIHDLTILDEFIAPTTFTFSSSGLRDVQAKTIRLVAC